MLSLCFTQFFYRAFFQNFWNFWNFPGYNPLTGHAFPGIFVFLRGGGLAVVAPAQISKKKKSDTWPHITDRFITSPFAKWISSSVFAKVLHFCEYYCKIYPPREVIPDPHILGWAIISLFLASRYHMFYFISINSGLLSSANLKTFCKNAFTLKGFTDANIINFICW